MATIFTAPGNKTIFANKIRPNDPCPCGSGKKAKKCCGTGTKYFYKKDIKDDPQQH